MEIQAPCLYEKGLLFRRFSPLTSAPLRKLLKNKSGVEPTFLRMLLETASFQYAEKTIEEESKMSANRRGTILASIKKCLMAIFLIAILSVALPPVVFAAGVADGVENPKTCKQCGMDRTVFTRSRMLIVYADGTTVGVCSLHCAAAEMRQNRDKQVKSLMVADYVTQELIDAKTATWVVGGNKQGVMTSLPKWAFARKEDAQKFIKENGGKISSFDETMKAAEDEAWQSGKKSH